MLHKLFANLCLTTLLICSVNSAGDELFGSSANNSLIQNTVSFLPVEEAYQLSAATEDDSLMLNWTISPGYYLFKHRFKFLWASDRSAVPQTALFEKGTNKYDDYYERELEVYYHNTLIQLPLPQLATTKTKLALIVESQGCADAGLCYPPRSLNVVADLSTGQVSVTEITAANEPSNAVEASTASLAGILLFAILGGMMLNLMPCVFPVLSIKVLSFTGSHISTHGKHIHGLAYTMGVVLSFISIAAILALLRSAGGAIGWGFQLQSPIFVGGLAYLFVLMGLSLSGLFEFGTRLMNLGQATTEDNSLKSSFMVGVLATVVASPCTAPFMGTAVGFALTQSTAVSTAVFASLGFGMALPFLLLSWWPGLAEKMPKPGAWMDSFKQFMAFPLYLSAIWLIWVLGRQTSADTVAALLVGIVLILFAIWAAQTRALQRRAPLKYIIVALTLASAVAIPTATLNDRNPDTRNWEPYTQARLNSLRSDGRAVFVNLTADWCITCLANEKLALRSARFRESLQTRGIAYLKGDWTNYNPEITELLNRNNRNGVPLYLLYPSGQGKPRVLPQLLTETVVLEALATIK